MSPPTPTPPGQGSSSGRRPLRRVDETSAGGLVLDRLGPGASGALIGRLDRRGRLLWSLPKGHVEPGETEPETAVREVEEETGIAGRVIGKLGTIDFWFVAEGRRVHKTVHHYLLLATDPGMFGSPDALGAGVGVPFAVFPMLMYHASQLFIDTAIADRMAARDQLAMPADEVSV